MRGEYLTLPDLTYWAMGSPPLAWGIHFKVDRITRNIGITPTCVGNTTREIGEFIWDGDHPHLRGEYRATGSAASRKLGSPPLAWGILQKEIADIRKYRITPTCVGNTTNDGRPQTINQDHPHLRGEYWANASSSFAVSGSPPLAWGIRSLHG